MHETIPLQILDPFTELFEVGHTSPPTVKMRRSSHGLTSALSPIVGMGEGLEHAPGTLRRLYKGENTGKFRHSVACGKRPSQRTGEIASAPLLSGTNKQEIADQICDLLDM
jgi:hypothetical protein